MSLKQTCFASPRLLGRDCTEKGGRGVYAAEHIRAGELLVVFAGSVVHAGELDQLTADQRRLVLQVEEEFYLLSEREGVADWVNHCCEPNAGLRGQVTLVAMRDIERGEEICYDYAMSDGSPYDHFECRCERPSCRGQITGDDWQKQALWPRYQGYFSPYLEARIRRLLTQRVRKSRTAARYRVSR